MAPEEFDALVAENFAAAQRDPAKFHARLIRLALVGYAYIAMLVVATAGAMFLAARLTFPAHPLLGVVLVGICGTFLQSVLRALRLGRAPKPRGIALSRADVPRLFDEIERQRALVQAPRIHAVRLTGDLNAGVTSRSPLGIFPNRNHLFVGLPILQVLPPDEFCAILAHELGHISLRHGRTSAWIYRLRARWFRLHATLDRMGRAKASVAPFLDWFAPQFNAAAMVICRAHEIDADKAAVEAASRFAAARALVRTRVLARDLERFWADVWRRVHDEPEPPRAVASTLAEALRSIDHAEASKWLSEELAVPTNNDDTHPCLADRLRAIGVEWSDGVPSVPPPAATASRTLLGERETELAERLDAVWRDAMGAWWRKRHKRMRAARVRMNGPAADDAASSRRQEWARLSVLVERADDELAIAELTRFLDHHPTHARARFLLGRTLLARDYDRSIEALEQAMIDDPRIVPAACALLRDHLQRTGRANDAKPYQRRAHDAGEMLERARRERADIDHATPLLPHGLDDSQLGDLRAIFDRHAGVRYVDMARARLSHLPQIPVYLIAVTLDGAWFEGEAEAARDIEDVLPIGADVACFVVRSNLRRLAKHVASQNGARVYEKRS